MLNFGRMTDWGYTIWLLPDDILCAMIILAYFVSRICILLNGFDVNGYFCASLVNVVTR